MKKEIEIDGLLYVLDKDNQESTLKICVDKKRIGEVIIPSTISFEGMIYNVVAIGKCAFAYCDKLDSVIIPDSVTKIGESAFYNCNCMNFSSINLPQNLVQIGDEAFHNCSWVESLTIPKNVISIGVGAFSSCTALADIIVEEGNLIYDSREGCNAIIETSSNTIIAGCYATIIPNTVEYIGHKAFSGCSFLASLNIPIGVKSIGKHAFAWCDHLASVHISNSVTSIGDYAFEGCENLVAIDIPKSVVEIGRSPFCFCWELNSIIVEEGNTVYDSRNNCNAIIETRKNSLIAGCCMTKIPPSVTSIGKETFKSANMGVVIIPKNLVRIEEGAFDGCNHLMAIRDQEEDFCSIFENPFIVRIPDKIECIEKNAFRKCFNIKNLAIFGETHIEKNAFEGCCSIANVYCHSKNALSMPDAFSCLDLSTVTLHVPNESIEKYKNTEPWCRFGSIVHIELKDEKG